MLTPKMPSLPSCSKRNDEEAERDGISVKRVSEVDGSQNIEKNHPLFFKDLQELTL
jgi:hypothetical protein